MECSSLVKSFNLLEALAGLGGSASLAAVTERAAVSKSNGCRILRTLVALGYVRQNTDRDYELTPRLSRLTRPASEAAMVAAVDPVLRDLRDRTGETVNFAVLDGEMVRYLVVHESRHPLRRVADADDRDPFYTTALGRALVSQLDPARQAHLLAGAVLTPRTEKTDTDREHIRDALAQAHKDGYAVEHDQCDLGVTCIGAPMMTDGEPLAAVSLSIPTVRCREASLSELIEAVRGTADEAARAWANKEANQ